MPKTVLVVEDDPSATYIFETMLAHAGYRPIVAGNAHDALRHLGEMTPDLMLIDVGLPGAMDGIELTTAVRSDHSPDLPILVVTVHAFPNDIERAWEAGCTDFMSKPVAPSEVLHRISQLIGPAT